MTELGKVLAFTTMPWYPRGMAIDDRLGRTFTVSLATPPWGWVAHHVQVVAWHPDRGWLLRGPGLSDAWVSDDMWRDLEQASLLVPR